MLAALLDSILQLFDSPEGVWVEIAVDFWFLDRFDNRCWWIRSRFRFIRVFCTWIWVNRGNNDGRIGLRLRWVFWLYWINRHGRLLYPETISILGLVLGVIKCDFDKTAT